MDRYHAIDRQHSAVIRRHPEPAATESSAEAHPLLRLQRQVGNAQIARLLAQRQEAPEEEELQASRLQRQEAPEEEELQASRLQRQEAPEEEELQASRLQRQEAPEEEELQASRLQRQEAPEEEELQASRLQRQDTEEEEVQASHDLSQREPEVGLEGGPVSAGVAEQINAQRGGGAPLDDSTRTQMEGHFGTSFEDVRVHTGTESAALNRSIAGRAFTTGNDIFLGDAASPADSHLMAHELTHVVQQRAMTGHSGPMSVTAAGDIHEQEADAVASTISNAAPAAPAQRHTDEHE
jgi:hypothetical protein